MAAVLKFPDRRPQSTVQEVRVADLDNGYTRLANELLDALIGADLTKNQYKVALAVVRKTYGFNKPYDRVSDGQLSELTGMPRQKVNKAKNELLHKRVLLINGRQIGLNKVVSEWDHDCHQNSDSVTKAVTKSVTKTVTTVSPKQGHTKDNIQNTKDKTIVATSGSQSADAELQCVADKSVSKQAIKQPAIQYQAFADAYNAILGHRLPRCEALSEKRKRAIKTLAGNLRQDRPVIEAFTAYIEDFRDHASGFYFGENDRGWRASFDYLVRVDTLIKAREGALMEGGRP
ncbi:MAG: replication protein [Aeromonas sp.]